jgi:hypothetical protein
MGTKIGSQISQRLISLVANSRYNGDRRFSNCPYYSFVIKASHIFDRAAAA